MGRQVSPTPGDRLQSRLKGRLENVWQVPIQSPAAWRKDGGTGKNSNTMFLLCPALRYALWLSRHRHKQVIATAPQQVRELIPNPQRLLDAKQDLADQLRQIRAALP